MLRRLAAPALALALGACVTDTAAIGDERSRAACVDAIVIEAPQSGCASETIVARSTFGCAVRNDREVLDEMEGTWVRLHRSTDRAASMRVTDLSFRVGEPSSAVVLTSGGPACTCQLEHIDGLAISNVALEWPLTYVDQELLLAAPGHEIQIEVCAVDEDPYPRCSWGGGDGGTLCRGLPYVVNGAVCACLPPCASSAECPRAATGGATPECLDTGCELRCSASAPCPEGQECIADYHGGTCMWPG